MTVSPEMVAEDRRTSRAVLRLILICGAVDLAAQLARVHVAPAGLDLVRWITNLSAIALWCGIGWAAVKVGPARDTPGGRALQRAFTALSVVEVGYGLAGLVSPPPPAPSVVGSVVQVILAGMAAVVGLSLLGGVLGRDGAPQLARSAKVGAWATAGFTVANALSEIFPPQPSLDDWHSILGLTLVWGLLGCAVTLWPTLLLWKFSSGKERLRAYELALASLALSAVSAAGFFALFYGGSSPTTRRTRVPLDAAHFPPRLHPLWSRELPEEIAGVSSWRPSAGPAQAIAVGDSSVYLLGVKGELQGSFPHPEAPGAPASLQVFDRAPHDPLLVLDAAKTNRFAAYDASGKWAWSHDVEKGYTADDMVPVGGLMGALAVGHNGAYGLCLLDGSGTEKWCNKTIGNVWFVSTLDCDGDGREEILSLSKDSHPYFGERLGCYDLRGKRIADIPVMDEPAHLRTSDLLGNGRAQLVAMWRDLSAPVSVAFWSSDGRPIDELELDTDENEMRAQLVTAHLRPGPAHDAVVSFPNGWILVLTASGRRWGLRVSPDPMGIPITAVDLDGDGRDELVVATGHTVQAFSFDADG